VFHKLQFSENQADSTSTEVSRFILGRIQVNYTEAARLVRQSGCLFQHMTGKFSLSGHVYYWNLPTKGTSLDTDDHY
jgi:hypothetical protein